MLTLLALACGSEKGAILATWPDDPDDHLAACAAESFDELRTTCLVAAAANYARNGQDEGANRACEQVAEDTWKEECHFRAGEEIARTGRIGPALQHCVKAGQFGHNCVTHSAWSWPPIRELSPSSDRQQVEAAGMELLSTVDQILAGSGGLAGEGRDVILARFGYNLYVGTGDANPGPAHIEGPLGVVLRTGFGIEAARLMTHPSMDAIAAVWEGSSPAPTGDALPPHLRVGRYTTPIDAPSERGVPHTPVFGGGLRLVGDTPEEDVRIAALEGMFWCEQTRADGFLPAVDDPSERVAWTAARLLRLTPPDALDMKETLGALADGHHDEGVRWHAADGLAHKTWIPRRRR